jgi:hypothetical protein
MQFLLVKVSCNAKNYTDQDDVNCEVPGRSKLQNKTKFSAKGRICPRIKAEVAVMH